MLSGVPNSEERVFTSTLEAGGLPDGVAKRNLNKIVRRVALAVITLFVAGITAAVWLGKAWLSTKIVMLCLVGIGAVALIGLCFAKVRSMRIGSSPVEREASASNSCSPVRSNNPQVTETTRDPSVPPPIDITAGSSIFGLSEATHIFNPITWVNSTAVDERLLFPNLPDWLLSRLQNVHFHDFPELSDVGEALEKHSCIKEPICLIALGSAPTYGIYMRFRIKHQDLDPTYCPKDSRFSKIYKKEKLPSSQDFVVPIIIWKSRVSDLWVLSSDCTFIQHRGTLFDAKQILGDNLFHGYLEELDGGLIEQLIAIDTQEDFCTGKVVDDSGKDEMSNDDPKELEKFRWSIKWILLRVLSGKSFSVREWPQHSILRLFGRASPIGQWHVSLAE